MYTVLPLCVALAVLIPSTAVATTSNGEIGLFFDMQGSECSRILGCNETATLYVYAVLQGSSAAGIRAAEYALRLGPDYQKDGDWLFSETWNPSATIVLGSAIFPLDVDRPFQDVAFRGRGTNVVFSTCQTGSGGLVLLQTVSITNVGCQIDEFPLQVISHDNASNPFFQCPLFNLCDDPVFTKVCLGTDLTICRNPRPPFAMNATCSSSERALVNPAGGVVADCELTAVQQSRWGEVKEMYR
jgi:hypothetical protein